MKTSDKAQFPLGSRCQPPKDADLESIEGESDPMHCLFTLTFCVALSYPGITLAPLACPNAGEVAVQACVTDTSGQTCFDVDGNEAQCAASYFGG